MDAPTLRNLRPSVRQPLLSATSKHSHRRGPLVQIHPANYAALWIRASAEPLVPHSSAATSTLKGHLETKRAGTAQRVSAVNSRHSSAATSATLVPSSRVLENGVTVEAQEMERQHQWNSIFPSDSPPPSSPADPLPSNAAGSMTSSGTIDLRLNAPKPPSSIRLQVSSKGKSATAKVPKLMKLQKPLAGSHGIVGSDLPSSPRDRASSGSRAGPSAATPAGVSDMRRLTSAEWETWALQVIRKKKEQQKKSAAAALARQPGPVADEGSKKKPKKKPRGSAEHPPHTAAKSALPPLSPSSSPSSSRPSSLKARAAGSSTAPGGAGHTGGAVGGHTIGDTVQKLLLAMPRSGQGRRGQGVGTDPASAGGMDADDPAGAAAAAARMRPGPPLGTGTPVRTVGGDALHGLRGLWEEEDEGGEDEVAEEDDNEEEEVGERGGWSGSKGARGGGAGLPPLGGGWALGQRRGAPVLKTRGSAAAGGTLGERELLVRRFLAEQGVTQEDLECFFEHKRAPVTMGIPLLRERVAFICSDLGLSRAQLSALLRQHPRVLEHPVPSCLRPHSEFLVALGLQQEQLPRVLRLAPKVFDYNIARSLAPRIRFLEEEVGVPREKLAGVIWRSPQVLTQSVKNGLAPRLRFFRDELPIPRDKFVQMVMRHPQLLHYSLEQGIRPRVQLLRSWGMSLVDVALVLQRCPQVLSLSVENTLVPKLDYLVRHLGGSVQSVVSFPAYFSLSLEKRIKPRYLYTLLTREQQQQQLGAGQGSTSPGNRSAESAVFAGEQRHSWSPAPGVGGAPFPLGWLALKDEVFCSRLGDPSVDEYMMFLSSFASEGDKRAAGEMGELGLKA